MDVLTLRLAVVMLALTALASIIGMVTLACHGLPENQGLTAAVSGAIGGVLGLTSGRTNGNGYPAAKGEAKP